MNAAQVNSNPSVPADAVSALVDGELDAAGLEALFAALQTQPQRLDQAFGEWHAYQVIGDVLRESLGAPVCAARRPGDFLAGVRGRLQVPVVQPVGARELPVAAGPVRPPAANDATFRWKMVAGFASLAAVAAVSWGVIGSPSAQDGGAAAPQLALTAPPPVEAAAAPAAPPVVAVAAPQTTSSEVVVNTGRGPMIRDARLEELLAEHRQHGGMSALQVPTGFIRGATYDATPGR